MATSVGPDGIDVTGYGWTNQSSTFNSNKSLESYGSPTSTLFNGSSRQGYAAWSYDPILTQGTAPSISTATVAALVYVPQNATISKVDWFQVAGTPNVTVGVWPSTAPAGTAVPLAYGTAAAATAGAVNTQSLNTSITLIGGQSYLVTVYGSTTGTIAAMVTSVATLTNASVSTGYTISTTYRAGLAGTVTYPLTGTATFGTSTLEPYLAWVGLH